MKIGFVITESSWAPYFEGRGVLEGETFVTEIPQSLLDAAALAETEGMARTELSRRLSIAGVRLQPLQAGVDIDEISDEDRARWKIWKRYVIALSKTPERPDWPATPDWPETPES